MNAAERRKAKYEVIDTSQTRCQCVMLHNPLIENGQAQCGGKRVSNLFCKLCEEVHGEYWRKNHPESGA